MRILHFENIPCWYALWWDSAQKALFIKMHRHFVDTTPHPDVARLFELSNHEEPDLFSKLETRIGQDTFGFDGAITRIATDDHWLKYRCKIPRVKNETGRACQECGGTGHRFYDDEESEDPCHYCDGDKKEHVLDWTELNKLGTSVSVLFAALEFGSDCNTPTDELQLFTVKSGVGEYAYIGGDMSPGFIDLLKPLGERSLPEVATAGATVYEQIFGKLHPFDRNCFRSYVTHGNLIANCPGDACGIHPSPHVDNIRPGHGVEFTCHNVDGVAQMVTLLCQLGAVSAMLMKTQ